MLHLIVMFFWWPICLMWWSIKLVGYLIIYIVVAIASLISSISLKKNQNNKKTQEIANAETKDSFDVEKYYENLENEVRNKRNKILIDKKENGPIPITDTELRITIEKIQDLYKEFGFEVKITGIVKKKYLTEYELIFSNTVTQADILSISGKVIDDFQIDGVKIIRDTKRNNRIYIQIPLVYGEILT